MLLFVSPLNRDTHTHYSFPSRKPQDSLSLAASDAAIWFKKIRFITHFNFSVRVVDSPLEQRESNETTAIVLALSGGVQHYIPSHAEVRAGIVECGRRALIIREKWWWQTAVSSRGDAALLSRLPFGVALSLNIHILTADENWNFSFSSTLTLSLCVTLYDKAKLIEIWAQWKASFVSFFNFATFLFSLASSIVSCVALFYSFTFVRSRSLCTKRDGGWSQPHSSAPSFTIIIPPSKSGEEKKARMEDGSEWSQEL